MPLKTAFSFSGENKDPQKTVYFIPVPGFEAIVGEGIFDQGPKEGKEILPCQSHGPDPRFSHSPSNRKMLMQSNPIQSDSSLIPLISMDAD